MAYTIKHKFTSGKADATDSTLVRPTAWNDDHDLQMDEGTIIGRPPGSGSGPGQSIPISSIYISGMMVMWPGATAPTGWLLCQGQSLLRADYPALFTIVGTSYGSADATHFNLPDMRGRVPAGVDGTGRLTAATMTNPHLLGGVGGVEQASAAFSLPAIGVSVGQWFSGGGFSGSTYGAQSVNIVTSFESSDVTVSGGGLIAAQSHTHSVNGNTGGEALGFASFGASGGTNAYNGAATAKAVQPTLTVNYIIKV